MKAIVYTKFGPPEVLHLQEVEKPTPKAIISARPLATFIPSMAIKNFGIIFIGVGLLTEALK